MIEVVTDTKYNLVFSHNDSDGILAAFTIKYAFDDNMFNKEWPKNVECILCDYSEKYNLAWFKDAVDEYLQLIAKEKIAKSNINIWMLDYTIEPYEDMLKFYNFVTKVLGLNFYWIDHHASSIENLSHYNIPGLQSVDSCGAVNTWNFIKSDYSEALKEEELPLPYKIINAFDMHNMGSEFSWDKQIMPFELIFKSFGSDLNDNNGMLISFLKNTITNAATLNTLMTSGEFLYNYIKFMNEKKAESIYKAEWDGYKCLVLNGINESSAIFENCESAIDCDLWVIWNFNGAEYVYDICTPKDTINVGELCKEKLNGGGHPKCGGGRSTEFIFSQK